MTDTDKDAIFLAIMEDQSLVVEIKDASNRLITMGGADRLVTVSPERALELCNYFEREARSPNADEVELVIEWIANVRRTVMTLNAKS